MGWGKENAKLSFAELPSATLLSIEQETRANWRQLMPYQNSIRCGALMNQEEKIPRVFETNPNIITWLIHQLPSK